MHVADLGSLLIKDVNLVQLGGEERVAFVRNGQSGGIPTCNLAQMGGIPTCDRKFDGVFSAGGSSSVGTECSVVSDVVFSGSVSTTAKAVRGHPPRPDIGG